MDTDATNLAHIIKPGKIPALAAVGGLVHPTPRGDVASDSIGSRAQIDNVRIRVRHSDGPGGSQRNLTVRDGDPVFPVVGGPEHPSAGHTHVEGRGLRGHPGHSCHPATLPGSDGSEVEALEKVGVHRLHHWGTGALCLALNWRSKQSSQRENRDCGVAIHGVPRRV